MNTAIDIFTSCRTDNRVRYAEPRGYGTQSAEAAEWGDFLTKRLSEKTSDAQARIIRFSWNQLAARSELLGLRYPLAREVADGYALVWSYVDITGMLALEVDDDNEVTWMLKESVDSEIQFIVPTGDTLPAEVVREARRFVFA